MQDYLDHNEANRRKILELVIRLEAHMLAGEVRYIDLNEANAIFAYYIEMGEYSKALGVVEYALESHPSASGLYLKLAMIEHELGRHMHALSYLDIALKYSPKNPEYLSYKAELYAQVDMYQKAIHVAEELMSCSSDPSKVYLQMGNIAQVCNQVQESESYYRNALELDPQYEEALSELAFLLESVERIQDAVTLYEEFLDDYPYSSKIWFHLGKLYRKLGLLEKSLDAFDFAIVIKEDHFDALYCKGQVQREMNQVEEALRSFLSAANIQKKDVHTLFHIGECYEQLNRPKEGARYYVKAAKLDPEYIDAWIRTGSCMEQSERYLEAISFYEKAHELDPDLPEVSLSLAECEYKLGNTYSASQYLKKAISLDPHELSIWQNWAVLMASNNNVAGAIAILEEGIKCNPKEAPLYYQIAAYYFAKSQVSEGMAFLEQGLLIDSAGHELLYQLAPNLAQVQMITDLIQGYIS